MEVPDVLYFVCRYLSWLGHPCINWKYNRKRYFWSFLSVISEGLLAAQLARIASSPYYSVLLDNSNDISNEDHCLIFLRWATQHMELHH